ncbi:probable proline--tRNA ligase, mitochondrial isoform X1 [Dermacentor albipictus]|uniref:probable proline--tRNA ligase, mitochondrial isoform X1 n=1 Tax=Dermacentor albipictus TaxID=60249 RepID=UPI0038FCC53B
MLPRRSLRCLRAFHSGATVPETFVRSSRLLQPSTFTKSDAKQALCKNQKLMLDYGLISSASTGTFVLLPMAMKALERLTNLIDAELQQVGGQKTYFPCLVPSSLFKKTGRLDKLGQELFTLMDRKDHDYCLGPTHEEAVTQLVTSLKTLPQASLPLMLYQITPKFRDEARPRFGLLRCREFIMKDMYSFDKTTEEAAATYNMVCEAYMRILKQLEVPFVKVRASTGAMGGSYSHEFHFLSDIGEDHLHVCTQCQTGLSVDEASSGCQNETCENCGGRLQEARGIEVAHAFSLGTTYSKPLNATTHHVDGKHRPLEMNCFGIGVTRLLAACLEMLASEDRLRWPLSIAPFRVAVITPKRGSHEVVSLPLAEHLAGQLSSLDQLRGAVLMDDRDDWTIGKRLKDLDTLGTPYVIVVGKKTKEPVPLFELHDTSKGTTTELTHSELLHFFQFGPLAVKRIY